MKTSKSIIFVLLIPFLLLVMVTLNLNQPDVVHAGPLAGLTPTPVPPPPDDGGSDNDDKDYTDDDDDDDDNDSDGGSKVPDDTTVVQLDPCDPNTLGSELSVQAQLIHQGSGFIVEGVLSDQQGASFALPYAGQWEVFMLNMPQLVGEMATDASYTNWPEVSQQVAQGPISLGTVAVGSPGAQLVQNPLDCVTTDQTGVPLLMPETGSKISEDIPLATALLVSGMSVMIVGLTLLISIRVGRSE